MECFIISRGWEFDQSALLRALDKVKYASFPRIQIMATMNRVVENVRPNVDAVILHIGSQELKDAAHSSVDGTAHLSSLAGSMATVVSRQIIKVAGQNRLCQFLISLPLPYLLPTSDEDKSLEKRYARRIRLKLTFLLNGL